MNKLKFYDFQIAIELLSYEIERASFYAYECNNYHVVLQKKIQKVYEFMKNEDNLDNWLKWNNMFCIQERINNLRGVVIPALCNLEKYQAKNLRKAGDMFDLYMEQLSGIALKEMQESHINGRSKVLLIGSGAFPTTAIAIARESGAEIKCADIDREAVELGALVIKKYRLPGQVHVINSNYMEYARWATHIIIASLVPEKEEILMRLWEVIDNQTYVVLRFGNGLKSIFNYPFQPPYLDKWNTTQVLSSAEDMYDVLILRKRW